MSSGTVLGTVVAAADLRQVFAQLPQPVAVVTGLSTSGEPVGMTVSSLTSASLSPPLVVFCPAVTSGAWAAARTRGSFAVNVLGHQHSELAARFAAPGDRFEGVRTLLTDDGLSVLVDALTVLVCDVIAEHAAGDHTVVVGGVRAVHAFREGTGLDTVSLRGKVPAGRSPFRRRRSGVSANTGRLPWLTSPGRCSKRSVHHRLDGDGLVDHGHELTPRTRASSITTLPPPTPTEKDPDR